MSSVDIAIIVPCFGQGIDKKSDFIKSIFEKTFLPINNMGYEKIIIQPVDENFTYLEKYKKVEFIGKVPKGIAIQEVIRKVIVEDEPKYILCIDGSGRIPSESLVSMMETFQDFKCDAVFAERDFKTEKGIDDERYAIERFEIFLIEDKYNVKLPDGQCGCWGFITHLESDRKINLTAKGYEIELDFLTEVLEKKLNYAFFRVNIESKNTVKSLFNKTEHETKIKFLAEKLGLKKWQLLATADQFNKEIKESQLPQEYIGMLNEVELKEPIIRE